MLNFIKEVFNLDAKKEGGIIGKNNSINECKKIELTEHEMLYNDIINIFTNHKDLIKECGWYYALNMLYERMNILIYRDFDDRKIEVKVSLGDDYVKCLMLHPVTWPK